MVVVNLVECLNCEFVFRGDPAADAAPAGRESCPNCGTVEFEPLTN